MRVSSTSDAGNPSAPNEDWALATEGLMVLLDGATVRTDTGCVHGVPWYVAKLGGAIAEIAVNRNFKLGDVLAAAIQQTARQHQECDLNHPGTPSAAVAIIRLNGDAIEYLLLGDAFVLVDNAGKLTVLTDDRVDKTATAERTEADRYPFGSAEKKAALLRMKRAELAARNTEGGYWIAASNPAAAMHAIVGSITLESVRRVAILSDGAARIATMFELLDWPSVLEVLDSDGPSELIKRVRAIEEADPRCVRWPRNKVHDDATAVFAS